MISGLERVGSVYVESERDDALLVGFNRYMERCLATRMLKRDDADIFFLVGESGAGKSVAIKRVLSGHKSPQLRQMSYGVAQPSVSIKLMGYTHPRLVGRQIVQEAGYGLAGRWSAARYGTRWPPICARSACSWSISTRPSFS